MIIDKIRNSAEYEVCAQLYIELAEGSMFEMDLAVSTLNLHHAAKSGFLRVIRESETDNTIRGWILGEVVQLRFCPHTHLEQTFYMSNYSGFKAAKAVILAHNALIEEAKRRRITVVSSHASHMDKDLVLCKILEKQGWKIQGYLCRFDLPKNPPRAHPR